MVDSDPGLVPRRIAGILQERSAEEPVIALHGPRSVGKSTLLRHYAAEQGRQIMDLDDLETREAVSRNPNAAIGTPPSPLCIDEYQHLPEILDAIKARLNRTGSAPGTAVLTGSTRHDALPRTAQALTGRLHSMVIWPLSQREIERREGSVIESLFEDPTETVMAQPTSSTTREEYAARLCAGGLPTPRQRSEASRARWFDDYLRTSIERDAVELFRIRQRQVLNEVLSRLAGRTAQILNVNKIGEGIGASRDTVESHIRLLEDLYLVHRLPAWGKTLHSRATSSPKVHVVDSGLAARLHRIGVAKLAAVDPTVQTEFGHLMETFVVEELRTQASWLPQPHTIGHWRTSDDDEVDFIIELDDGRVLAFEVKASERIPGKDFTGLRKLRKALGDRFVAGIALSTGTRSYTYEERLHVMPVDRLWF